MMQLTVILLEVIYLQCWLPGIKFVKSLIRIEMLKAKLVLLNCLIKVSSIVSVIEFCYVTLKPGRQVQEILDKSVVQIKKTEEDKFQMNIRDQTHMFDNNPFRSVFINCSWLMAQYSKWS